MKRTLPSKFIFQFQRQTPSHHSISSTNYRFPKFLHPQSNFRSTRSLFKSSLFSPAPPFSFSTSAERQFSEEAFQDSIKHISTSVPQEAQAREYLNLYHSHLRPFSDDIAAFYCCCQLLQHLNQAYLAMERENLPLDREQARDPAFQELIQFTSGVLAGDQVANLIEKGFILYYLAAIGHLCKVFRIQFENDELKTVYLEMLETHDFENDPNYEQLILFYLTNISYLIFPQHRQRLTLVVDEHIQKYCLNKVDGKDQMGIHECFYILDVMSLVNSRLVNVENFVVQSIEEQLSEILEDKQKFLSNQDHSYQKCFFHVSYLLSKIDPSKFSKLISKLYKVAISPILNLFHLEELVKLAIMSVQKDNERPQAFVDMREVVMKRLGEDSGQEVGTALYGLMKSLAEAIEFTLLKKQKKFFQLEQTQEMQALAGDLGQLWKKQFFNEELLELTSKEEVAFLYGKFVLLGGIEDEELKLKVRELILEEVKQMKTYQIIKLFYFERKFQALDLKEQLQHELDFRSVSEKTSNEDKKMISQIQEMIEGKNDS